ncbi:MAG: prepilin-type N-terminal cleavage/methylation domain-containing protein [Legionellaceae bacterium]|nr:prepilin-type N-terminal cleavage/methylation domain-containing protein [Legionellaceae bacterium]
MLCTVVATRSVVSTGGFTLFECLIVLTILGMLCAFALPFQAQQIEKTRQKLLIEEIKSAIAYARVMALSQQKVLHLQPLDAEGDWSQGACLSQEMTEPKHCLRIWRWKQRGFQVFWQGFPAQKYIRFASFITQLASNGYFRVQSPLLGPRTLVLNRLGHMRT